MMYGFCSNETIKRVGMHARQLAAQKNNFSIHRQKINLKKCQARSCPCTGMEVEVCQPSA